MENFSTDKPKSVPDVENETIIAARKQVLNSHPSFSSINNDCTAAILDISTLDDQPLITPTEECNNTGINNIIYEDQDNLPAYTKEIDEEKLPLPDATIFSDSPSLISKGITTLPDAEVVLTKPPAQEEKFRITIEPAMIFVMLGISFQTASATSLLMFMSCHVTFNHSEIECRNQSSAASTSSEVQGMTADIILYKSFLEIIPAMIIAFFIGPWSDKHGRKLPIILPVCGFIVSSVASLLAAIFIELPPQFIFLPSGLIGITGNMACFFLGIFSYMSDISSPKTRTFRMAIVDLSMVVGLGIGIASNAAIYKQWGYVPSYGIALGLYVIGFIYLICFTRESVKKESHEGLRQSVQHIFHFNNVLETIRVCLKKRDGNQRGYILALIAAVCVILLPFLGASSINLLYVTKKFSWDQTDLGYYTSYGILVSITGMVILFRCVLKKLKISDLVIGIIGVAGFVMEALFMALSEESWELYLGATLAFFHPLALPISRSVLTKLVSKGEQGKIFALMTSCETFMPIVSNTIYTQLYKATEATFPGAAFLFTASVMIIPTICFSWIYVDMKKKNITFNEIAAQNQQTFETTSKEPKVPDLSPINV